MFRTLLLTSFLGLASVADAGIIGVGGSTSDLAPEELAVQLLYTPEVKVDPATYGRIKERLSKTPRVRAVFRGENMELMKLRVGGQDAVVESRLRLKITRQ